MTTCRLSAGPAVFCAPQASAPEHLHYDLLCLRHCHERHAAHIYFYSAASLGFTAELAVDDDGFVRSYPGLWTRDA